MSSEFLNSNFILVEYRIAVLHSPSKLAQLQTFLVKLISRSTSAIENLLIYKESLFIVELIQAKLSNVRMKPNTAFEYFNELLPNDLAVILELNMSLVGALGDAIMNTKKSNLFRTVLSIYANICELDVFTSQSWFEKLQSTILVILFNNAKK